jgi:hypothetical protein
MQDFDFEVGYWGDCTNTFDEDQKHYVYAGCMGLLISHYTIKISPARILDVGGGPTSMLLKTDNLVEGKVWDPIKYPDWTIERYRSKNISVCHKYGEELDEKGWDEVWLYNCLQHTHDPGNIISNCLKAGKIFRIFEWIDIPAHEGHPQSLTKEGLDEWLGAEGKTFTFNNANGCTGRAYAAVVPGANLLGQS